MTRFDDDPVYADLLFRQPRRHGKWRAVEPPVLGAPVADTHAHVQLLPNPPLALARAGVFGVDFICTIVDVWEDGSATFDCLEEWREEAAGVVAELVERSLEPLGQPPRDLSAPALRASGRDDVGESLRASGRDDVWPFEAAELLVGEPEAARALAVAAAERAAGREATACVPRMRIAVGCHPHNASHWDDALEALLRERLADPRVAALGEVGLDYHYDFSPRDVQREVFRRQIRIAKELQLPLILHMREAHDDGFAILEEEGWPEAGVLLHCFNLDWAEAQRWVERGCYVAFGGPLTFKNAEEVRQAAAQVPWDRLLTETDSPYMTPEPMRGLACEPAHTVFTAAMLCQVEGLNPDTPQATAFLQDIHANALRLLDANRTSSRPSKASGEIPCRTADCASRARDLSTTGLWPSGRDDVAVDRSEGC